jgi:hypothetical protein
MRQHLRGQLVTALDTPNETQPRCDCGWLRPRFVDLRQPDRETPIVIGQTFYLCFDCPQCGARWDVCYGKTT